MTVLITGAGGFVGHALVESFGRTGVPVRAVARGLSEQQRARWHTVDIRSIDRIDADTRWTDMLGDVDVIVHLAARVHVMRDRARDPLAEFRAVNTLGTLNLARQAAAYGVRRMVYVSSIKVNGEATEDAPFRETDVPNPQDPYAISKWEAEQGLAGLAQETGLEIVVVRPPLVYGPGVKGNFLSLMRLLELGLPLPLQRCDNRRSLLALENLADLLVCCATHPAASGQTFLASDGEDLSTPDLLQRLGQAMGCPAHLWPVPPAWLHLALRLIGKGAVYERLCGSLHIDSSKARQVMGWVPPRTVDEGLRRTALWYQTRP